MQTQFWPLTFWKRDWWQQWFRVSESSNNVAVLGSRQIYIIPTRWGLLYAVMVFLLLLGSINYSLSLGFYLTFLLTSLGCVAMFHTWLNFAHLEIEILSAKPVFAGEEALVHIQVKEHKNQQRYSIAAHFEGESTVVHPIPAQGAQLFAVPISTTRRGWMSMPKLICYTEFPLGLFHAWAVVRHPLNIMVYASPSANPSPVTPVVSGQASESPHANQQGDDDFIGHKSYQIGDAPSRLDWKASSRGVGMLTKRYSGNAQEILWLDWAATQGLPMEERIAMLTKSVIDAHGSQLSYGLKLPGNTIQPGQDDAHYHRCLQALALL